MFSRKYWNKNKKATFPEIKDWTNPQNEYRYFKDIKKMPWKYWFYFHPSSFILLQYGGNILSIIMFTIMIFYFQSKELTALATLSVLFIGVIGYDLYKKVKNYKAMKQMNFYDLFMREIKIDKVK